MMDELKKRTWAEVSLENIEHNYRSIRNYIRSDCKFCGIVKADAYGHGAVEVSKLLQKEGADYLAVSCLDEALELRKNGIVIPILILGHTPYQFTEQLIDNDITQTITCLAKAEEYAAELKRLGKTLKVHMKIDTGMSRLGFIVAGDSFDEGIDHIEKSCKFEGFDVEGIFTHFAVSDEPGNENNEYTRKQFGIFLKVIDALKERGIEFRIRHCANTGATVNFPEMQLDMVRPGYLLYGYGDDDKKLDLKPCMRFVTTVSTIKHYEAGTSISYGCKYTTKNKERIAVLACGYADGLSRAASGKCEFATAGGFTKQVGNICMDMCMADITDLPDVQVGSEVELFGEKSDIRKLADAAYTIPYELMCGVTKRVPRIYY